MWPPAEILRRRTLRLYLSGVTARTDATLEIDRSVNALAASTNPVLPVKHREWNGIDAGKWLSPFSFLKRKSFWAGGILGALVAIEMRTSYLQSRALHAAAARIHYRMHDGPSPQIHFPGDGPYDQSLGYSRLPKFLARLEKRGFQVQAQARVSEWFLKSASWGLYPIYREKAQAGIQVLGPAGDSLYTARFPGRIYDTYESIPPIIVNSLLFIENREITDEAFPKRNPAVEWDRFAKAILDLGVHKVYSGHSISGGSTLATQMEKIRHSSEGRTRTASDKWKQMASASLRVYQNGEDTLAARKLIVRDYINSIPLAAIPGYGEVRGLGDGLWAWHGADFAEVNQLMASIGTTGREEKQAVAYRQVLGLLLALKKPTTFLVDKPAALDDRIDAFLPLLASTGRIPESLARASQRVRLQPRKRAPEPEQAYSFAQRKATDAVRAELLSTLGLESFYDLDRLDMSVKATLDPQTTGEVASILRQFQDPQYAAAAGLFGQRMLTGDPAKVTYSFSLYERRGQTNFLRVQSDNYNQPLNINEGTKLELGSTAKLRTLVHYLEVIASLHSLYSGMDQKDFYKLDTLNSDRLTRWSLDYLEQHPGVSLAEMLDAAMLRTYSANPKENFFTAGGLLQFSNFDAKDNNKVLTLRDAFRRSVNLVFIRLMRDLAQFHTYHLPNVSPSILKNDKDPMRATYLSRFADFEGKQFLNSFWRKYRGMTPDDIFESVVHGTRPLPQRLAVVYRSTQPKATVKEFTAFLEANLKTGAPAPAVVKSLYETYAPEKLDWNDKGYIARRHPIDLWLAGYLIQHPTATLTELAKESAVVREESYKWLHTVRGKSARDKRISIMLEADAFDQIHTAWARLGFPFDTLVPSYATAIGSSGDNPAALAELMGIIVSGGTRYPMVRVEEMHFGAGTPTETIVARKPEKGERVLPPEVAETIRRELAGVVESGTAGRAKGALQALTIGGKTGTGDNRFETHGPGNKLLASTAINRTATFVFYAGDHFFGVITAFVDGPEADSYKFTSALPVQIFRHLAPAIQPLILASAP